MLQDTRKPWIALCEVGVRSSLFCLLLELYCGQIIPNYDGSMMEWGLYRELPIVCKHKPDKK